MEKVMENVSLFRSWDMILKTFVIKINLVPFIDFVCFFFLSSPLCNYPVIDTRTIDKTDKLWPFLLSKKLVLTFRPLFFTDLHYV